MKLAALGLVLALATCSKAPPMAVPPAPSKLPPSLCIAPPPSPTLPDDASLVRPATDEERAGMQAFLTWVAALVDHDREVTRRSGEVVASEAC